MDLLEHFFLLIAFGITLLGFTRLHSTLLIRVSGVVFASLFALLFVSKTAWNQRFILSSRLFLFMLLWIQPLVLHENEESLNGLRPIATAIQEDFRDKDIWVFNRLTPSLRLYTGKDLNIIADQSKNIRRETYFLKNKPGEVHYHDLKNRQILKNLESGSWGKAILVVYKKDMRNKYCQILASKFAHQHMFKKWIIFY